MAFGFFRKKKEVIDLSNPDDSGIPSQGYLKRKAKSDSSDFSSSASNSGLDSSTPSSQDSGSANFFGFLGSDSSSASSTSSASSISQTNQNNQFNQTSFSQESINTNSQLADISVKISRILDRLELVEKKIDRLERRSGVVS